MLSATVVHGNWYVLYSRATPVILGPALLICHALDLLLFTNDIELI